MLEGQVHVAFEFYLTVLVQERAWDPELGRQLPCA